MDGSSQQYDRDFFTNLQKGRERIFRVRGLDFLEGKIGRLRAKNREFPKELVNGVVGFLEKRKKPTVLDAPCGKGQLLIDLEAELGDRVRLLGFDKYPEEETKIIREVDLDNVLPLDDHSVDLLVSMYGTRYLQNPLNFLNEALRVTKKGGLIIANGINSMKLDIGKNGESDDVRFFSEWLGEDKRRVHIFEFPSDGDWVAIRVVDPNFRFNLEMVSSYSIITGTGDIDIRSGARFVYKRKTD